MLPFLLIGAGTTLYVLWALTAFPFQVYVRQHSIVYSNQGTSHMLLGCSMWFPLVDHSFFSKVKDMVIFGAVNLLILLLVMAVKEYAFTSVWCTYAAVASVIVLAYFGRSIKQRPFSYLEAI